MGGREREREEGQVEGLMRRRSGGKGGSEKTTIMELRSGRKCLSHFKVFFHKKSLTFTNQIQYIFFLAESFRKRLMPQCSHLA